MERDSSWVDRFAGLGRLEQAVRDKLVTTSQIVRLPAGSVIFGPGMAPKDLLLLIDGSVRVQQTSEGGREIVLYRVSAGESCVLTTACLLAYEGYLAEGVAETDIEAVAIPRATFDTLVAQSPEFRRFVFTAFSERITDLFRLIDEVAFKKIDIRLAHRLLTLADADGRLGVTHQELANELGTTREVVSRQLLEFQRRGWIKLARGQIEVLDAAPLEQLAEVSVP
ncbi:MAG: Crp/Fnr family transcriptional regulator [Hyphomicrobiaceae bacterium]